ncbi:outer membrane protein assembly factor BamB family protein [Anatilimnocola floriformis]|uniref:outer membrane protein assembly factor BamB family protein n=1 Tax=Anatilimnocola floriformis TaxID=2948575 RepID=UPI0020C286D5|nr:PQQ-binding-like beta-propeller repeat protein [Anatilimnocola floriformis]
MNCFRHLRLFAHSASCVLLVALLLLGTTAVYGEDDIYVQHLAKYGVEPTAESIAAYLKSLTPSTDQKQTLQKLIGKLDDESYATREAATRELVRQPSGLNELLAAAIAGGNPEVRWRAQLVSEQTTRESQALLHAALMAIAQQKITGLATPLLEVSQFCTAEPLRSPLRRALVATLLPNDTSLLTAALKAPEADLRALAAYALPSASATLADEQLPKLLSDDSTAVKMVAARALANHGRREALPVLVELLGADDLPLRVEAFRTLKAATGQSHSFVVYDSAEKRATQQQGWRDWLAGDGKTAELKFPLRESQIELGRLLVCDQQQNQLIEYDAQGKVVWTKQTPPQPWGCQGLENGHRLVCCYTEKVVIEYDTKGDEVWKAGGLPGGPTSVQRLESGNTLLACTEGSELVEVDRSGKIVWRVQVEGRPVDARRLEDGRTLVALQNAQKVVEVDTAGKVVWELAGVGNAFCAQRLDNGNTLVCTVGNAQVREFDRDGKVVWAQGKFQTPYTAQRLSNGNTMVVDRKGVHEIDPAGEEVSLVATPRLSRAWKY